MKNLKRSITLCLSVLVCMCFIGSERTGLFIISADAADIAAKAIKLPAPQKDIGRPLMKVLSDRKSGRNFSSKKLSPQDLSNLLWAAFGINRPDGKRTAPSARNWQDIDIYAVMENGVFLYEAKTHSLMPVLGKDIRGDTGSPMQTFVRSVPLNLLYVSDYAKMPSNLSKEERMLYSGVHTGFIAQNIYLYCSSQKLATVFRAFVDRDALAKTLNLRKDQRIVFVQSVGYPEK